MTSEITRTHAASIGARVVQESPHSEPAKSQASAPVAIKKVDVELPKPASTSFDPVASRKNVKEAVAILNDQMASNKRDIGFTVNNESSTPIVTVRNISTGEVVRQIPNEVVIKLAKGIDNFKGAIHNKQA
jgi:flagellar protein FlaG